MTARSLLFALLFCPALFANTVTLLDDEEAVPFNTSLEDLTITAHSQLIVDGFNPYDAPKIMAIRIDNQQSDGYRTRLNNEFTVNSGRFEIIQPLTGLKTSGGQPLEPPYTELYVFAPDSELEMEVHRVKIQTAASAPQGTLALDFGSANSAAYPGLTAITANHDYITGTATERVRVSGSALVQDGLSDLTSITIPWEKGRWKVSLWTQDQGWWEYLPHYLTRKITVNGVDFVNEQFSPQQWVEQVYMAGTQIEASPQNTLWDTTGLRRSGFVSREVEVYGDTLELSFEGNGQARFLAGLVVEPVTGHFAEYTLSQKRKYYLNRWPVQKPHYSIAPFDQTTLMTNGDAHLSAARDSVVNLSFTIHSVHDDSNPVVLAPRLQSDTGERLNTTLRYGHWRYERPEPNATGLVMNDSYLRSDLESLTLTNELPRNLYLQVHIPPTAVPGLYSGAVQVYSYGELLLQNYTIEVLPMTLPRLTQPVGLYHEPAPYHFWFPELQQQVNAANECDYRLLQQHGFTTVAPLLATPSSERERRQFVRQVKHLQHFGLDQGVMAYAPLKRLMAQKSLPQAMSDLVALKTELDEAGAPPIYWSIYDEPAPRLYEQIQGWATLLHDPTLNFKTAGHYNNPHQTPLLPVTDLIIMNHGAGVSLERISELQQNAQVWLYNLPNPRIGAGFYLWKSGADGYLQWHGRMPTADPFDPTDGREGDAIYLYPSLDSCATPLNIHKKFLDLHEAINDLRWLKWLELTSKDNEEAQRIFMKLKQSIPNDWNATELISDETVRAWRSEIIHFFQSTQRD